MKGLLLLSILNLAGVAALHAAAGPEIPQPSPPNVVLIVSDDQAWTDYGFMGHPLIRTPRLDRLAAESLLFTHGYVPGSLCCPSLASIITGLYPHQHGITSNEPPRRLAQGNPYRDDPQFLGDLEYLNSRMREAPALPRMLEPLGYRSFQSGKWWMGSPGNGGFTEGMTHGDPARGGRHGDEGLRIGREGMEPVFDFIRRCGDKPFFVWYAPFLPHTPHDPPERFLAKYRDATESPHVARYFAMCEWFDETCGALLDFLEEHSLSERTLVAYVADNGWIQDPEAPRYALRSKQSPYDGGLRTPLMLRWPGRITPDRIERAVSSIDLAPTLLKACGLQAPAAMPGVDLRDLDAVQERRTVFGDCHLHHAIDVRDPTANWTYRWCLRDGWKLILPNPKNVGEGAPPGAAGSGRVELYHVAEDPHETQDLAASEPDKVMELSAAIEAWWPAKP
ncbi:MAG TPA: sulfatase-like hydrolase/transferase [Verrucomicrobiales bacterium]|nr:sulfatase-like hydrolase/transferase [Verrucomicrobiales bacterium]